MVVGCSKNSSSSSSTDTTQPDLTLPEGYEQSTTQLGFTASTDVDETSTKGVLATNDFNFKSFGLFAYFLEAGSNDTAETIVPNFMYDQQVTKSNAIWSYSPIKYWPTNTSDELQFFAYSPYGESTISVTESSKVGFPEVTVTPASKPYNQYDFMTALTDPMNITEGGNGVPLVFKHKLAQARFYAAHKGYQSTGTDDASKHVEVGVMGITVSGLRGTGTIAYNATEDDYKWTHDPENTTETALDESLTATYAIDATEISTENVKYLATASADPDDYTYLDLDDSGKSIMLLIPQNLENCDITFIVQFSYTKDGSTVQAFKELNLHSTTLKENSVTSYLMLIDPDGVGLGTITVTSEPWTDTTLKENDDIVIE